MVDRGAAWLTPRLRTYALPTLSLGVLVTPAAAVAGPPIRGGPGSVAIVLAVTAIFAAGGLLLSRGRLAAAIGVLLGVLSCWLLTEASYNGSVAVAASALGFGAALVARPDIHLVSRRSEREGAWSTATPFALAAGVAMAIVAVRMASVDAAAWMASGCIVVAAALAMASPARAGRSRMRASAAAAAAVALAAFAVFWVGSTSPTVTWFGSLTSHGSRATNEVAITFDDGPNGESTLAMASILEERGLRGTFFIVGKAAVREPEVVRDLVARGHTVANHSYHHDAWRYLDPGYPELDRAEAAIRMAAGVCPALFRPPHGTHTPFMSSQVDDRGMTLVTWDVSARDWVETDAERIARDILERARPGSIILLHDGIDGDQGADRSATERALPLILDGLAAKGLKPVTVDQLLGKAPYLAPDAC